MESIERTRKTHSSPAREPKELQFGSRRRDIDRSSRAAHIFRRGGGSLKGFLVEWKRPRGGKRATARAARATLWKRKDKYEDSPAFWEITCNL